MIFFKPFRFPAVSRTAILQDQGDTDRRQCGEDDCEKLNQKKASLKDSRIIFYHFRFI